MINMRKFTIITLAGPVFQIEADYLGKPNASALNFFAWGDARKRPTLLMTASTPY